MSGSTIHCQPAVSNFNVNSSPNHADTTANKTCERLLQVSFSKIVNSKNERGGAKLRKNLLIVHLIQRAQSEKRAESMLSTTSPSHEDNSHLMNDDEDDDDSSLPHIDHDITDNTAQDTPENSNTDHQPPRIDLRNDQFSPASCDSAPCGDNNYSSTSGIHADCCQNQYPSDHSTAVTDDAGSTCSSSSSSDDSVSEDEEPCWRSVLHDSKKTNQARKRKIWANQGAEGVSAASSKRPRELCATDAAELQGLIDVFKTGLAGVGSPATVADPSRRSSTDDQHGCEEEGTATPGSVYGHPVPPTTAAILALTCVS